MRLEKFIYKKKKEIPFHSLLSPFRPAGHSFPAGLAWPASPSSPAARSPSPFPPSSRSILGRPSIAPSPAAARLGVARTRQLPRPAADARAPPVGAAPNLPRPAPAPGQGGTAVERPGVVGAPPLVPLGLVKRQPSPPSCAPAAPLQFRPAHAPEAPATVVPRSPDFTVHLRAGSRLRAVSASDFRPW